MSAGAATPGAPALFISDLHLAPGRDGALAAFHAFARGPARAASAVYVMGEVGLEWLAQKPGYEGCVITHEGGMRTTDGWPRSAA